MTQAGRIEIEFNNFKVEMEARVSALEAAAAASKTEEKKTTTKSKKSKDIVVEAKDNDIVATEVE